MNLLLFEDDYTTHSNVKFRLELIEEIHGINLDFAGSFNYFEKYVKKNTYEAFILDIMSIETEIKNFKNGNRIEKSLVGIEILDRLRCGYYNKQKKDSLIIMRSARATEPDIRRLCIQKKSDYILSPGSDDHKIIDILKRTYNH